MKYVRLRIRFPPSVIHPVHEALGESDAVERDVLLYGDTDGPGPDTFLFYAEGDPDAYAAMLAATDSVTEYELSRIDDESCYAFITQETPEFDADAMATFDRGGVLAMPPIEFHPDGTATLTVVGDSTALQASVDELPEELDAQVERIGEYDRRQELFDPGLTERQFEAVRAAVAVGYYDSPRTGRVETVGERLGVAPGTAAEHLRKAESRVMREFVRRLHRREF